MRIKWKRTCFGFAVVPIVVLLLFVIFRDDVWRYHFVSKGRSLYSPYADVNTSSVSFFSQMSIISVQQSRIANPSVTTSQAGESVTGVKHYCANISCPAHLATYGHWLPVTADGNTAYVFSAYLDDEATSTVTIIGAAVRGGSLSLTCQLWYKLGQGLTELQETPVASELHPENHGRKYSVAVFKCSLPRNDIPQYVSLVVRSCSTPLNLLRIHTNTYKPNATYERNFTVCVTPLNFRYGRAYELVEWLELNVILGAEKFMFYNHSSARNVARVLDLYSRRGLVNVIQWRLPMGVDTFPKTDEPVDIHYFGQLAALNDCLMRNKRISEYIVTLDLDEFIIPHSNKSFSWTDILLEIQKPHCAVFRNVFFRKEWTRGNLTFPTIKLAEKYKLVTLLKTEHDGNIWTANQRSKYMVQTNAADLLGVHYVPRMKSGYARSSIAPLEVALLHHYRNWEEYNDTRVRQFDDTVVRKFADALTFRVENIWSEMEGVEQNIPVN